MIPRKLSVTTGSRMINRAEKVKPSRRTAQAPCHLYQRVLGSNALNRIVVPANDVVVHRADLVATNVLCSKVVELHGAAKYREALIGWSGQA